MNRLLIVGLALACSSAVWAQKKGETAPPTPAPPPAAKAAAPPTVAPAPPAPVAAVPMPKPAPEMEQLKFFEGKWKCEGTAFASPMMGPEHKMKGAFNAKSDLGGFWMTYRIDDEKTKDMPAFNLAGYVIYDAAAKKFQRWDFDSMGSVSHFTSPGFEGDKMVFTGDMSMAGKKMAVRHTITKTDKAYGSMMEMGTPDGKWAKMMEETCKKKSAK